MTRAPADFPLSRTTGGLCTYDRNCLSPASIRRNDLYACNQQNAWNENPSPVPVRLHTHQLTSPSQSQLSKGTHVTHGALMYYDHLFLPPHTGNITCSPFTSFSCSFLLAFGTARYKVPQLNAWGSPASTKLSVLWFQPKPPAKALMRRYHFSEGIWSYCEEFDTFTGPEAARLRTLLHLWMPANACYTTSASGLVCSSSSGVYMKHTYTWPLHICAYVCVCVCVSSFSIAQDCRISSH